MSTDDDNTFLNDPDAPLQTRIGRIGIARANYDPTGDLRMKALNLNVDRVFGTANDLVVPFDGAGRFDEGVRFDFECAFGTPIRRSPPSCTRTSSVRRGSES